LHDQLFVIVVGVGEVQVLRGDAAHGFFQGSETT
jgi:hypothetical protein